MAKYEAGRIQRQKSGPTWACGGCSLRYPAEAYDVDRHDITDLHQMCIAQGYFRMCTVCAQIRVHTHDDTKLCSKCTQHLGLSYFTEDSDICKPCLLRQKYLYDACSICQQPFPVHDLREASSASGHLMCYRCAREAWP